MTGFGPGQPEVGSTGRVEYSQYVKVPLSSIYSCIIIAHFVVNKAKSTVCPYLTKLAEHISNVLPILSFNF